jgi:hypothetical protein
VRSRLAPDGIMSVYGSSCLAQATVDDDEIGMGELEEG